MVAWSKHQPVVMATKVLAPMVPDLRLQRQAHRPAQPLCNRGRTAATIQLRAPWLMRHHQPHRAMAPPPPPVLRPR